MIPRPVTTSLIHHLVAGSHAEATTRLAVAVVVEAHDRVLLTAVTADNFDCLWEPPTDLVLPGETLTDAVHRTAAQAEVDIDRVTGYLGHRDVRAGDDIVRTFAFAAAIADPDRIYGLGAGGPHQWAAVDDLPEGIDDDIVGFLHAAAPAVVTDGHDLSRPLHQALRAHARRLLADEAAIELLIAGPWPGRRDFVDRYIENITGSGAPMALVDWPAAVAALDTGALSCSGGEDRMLRIAASLAARVPIDLRDALTGLDTDNIDLVTHAMLHTAGQ